MSSLKKTPQKQVTRLMAASAQCAEYSTLYGKCVAKNYQHMSKDACLQEFLQLKKCVQQHLKRKL